MPEVLYGRNPVREALRAGRRLRRLLVASGLDNDQRVAEIVLLASQVGVAPELAERGQLADIAHTEHHQGVAGYFDSRQLPGMEFVRHLLREPRRQWPALILCLDGVQDPQNLGALARAAESLGVDAMVLPKHRTAPASAAAVKASAGALEHLPLVRVVNLSQTLQELTDLGLLVVGLDQGAETRTDEADFGQPLALVVGSEGEGLRHLTKRRCGLLISIPMGGQVDSLNAAVAGSVVLYEVARQRRFAFPGRSGR
ncbi:MAG TPA: 23S rRNA (guanosine(2251)-2'-O)-methyltransferase RlmB [Candidatus Dormibacteraeota bacterium]|nr:23S rRNA (guanosine(2251)-2'-O)-methyltransferase RlmB [Candidatus Dormibacteraeota bacterium]